MRQRLALPHDFACKEVFKAVTSRLLFNCISKFIEIGGPCKVLSLPVADFFETLLLWLKNFPFPPSDNKLHQNGRRPNQRFKSKEYLKFLELVEDYAIFAQKELEQPRRLSLANKRFSVRVDCYFERSSLITKKGTFKRIDAQNRLKALLDALASLMYCDDSTFWRVTVEKKVSPRNESYTDIYLEEYLEQ